MDRIDQYSFYSIGQALQKMAAYTVDAAASELLWDLVNAQGTIRRLLNGQPIPISIARPACLELLQVLNQIEDTHFKVKDEDGTLRFKFPGESDPPIEAWRFNYYRQVLQKFEVIFAAEMQETATYFVPRRGIYSTTSLVDSAHEAFPKHLLAIVPEKSQHEWRAAGRCLAFNLLSASGFHVARAVEGVIEELFDFFIPNGNREKHTWGDFIREFEGAQKSGAKISEKTIIELRQMKDDFRNPLMHPRVVLSEADARVLFDNGESLIISMAEEISQETIRDLRQQRLGRDG